MIHSNTLQTSTNKKSGYLETGFFLKDIGEFSHLFAGTEFFVEHVIDHVSDRDADSVGFVDLLQTGSSKISLGNHCHFVESALDRASLSDELTETAVAAELRI